MRTSSPRSIRIQGVILDPSLLQKLFLKHGIEYFTLYILVGWIVISIQNWRMREDPKRRVNFWRFLLLGAVLLAVFLVGTISSAKYLVPAKTWTTITPEGEQFSASIPGKFSKIVDNQFSHTGGGKVTTTSYFYDGGPFDVKYAVNYFEMPKEMRMQATKPLLEKMRDLTLKEGYKLVSSQSITLGSNEGIDYTYSSDIGVTRTLIFVNGSRLYNIWASPLTGKDDPNGKQFFDSFKFIDNEKVEKDAKP